MSLTRLHYWIKRHWLLILLTASIVAAFANFLIFDFMQIEPRLISATLTEEAFEARMREFTKVCDKLDAHLKAEKKIDNFDQFYDLAKNALSAAGSFSEGGLDDADFSSSRYVDPGRILTIVSSVPITEELLQRLLSVCAIMGPDYAIMFDGIEGQSVLFTSGEFFRQSG